MNKIILILTLLLSVRSEADIYTLGDGNNCSYDFDDYTIQQVIDDTIGSGDTYPIIRITNQKEYFENLQVSNSLLLSGGFADCNAALSNNATGKTKINGNHVRPVLTVSDNLSIANVSLYDFTLTNGKGLGSSFGGGISIIDNNDQSLIINLYDVTISNSEGYYGGGIYVHGGQGTFNPLVILTDSIVINNDGLNNGGGIYCFASNVRLSEDTRLIFNQAFNNSMDYGNGGGIYASTGCSVEFDSTFSGQLYGNSSSAHGGGIYIRDNAEVVNRGSASTTAITFKGNFSDANASLFGNGGGVYLNGANAKFDLSGVVFEGNKGYYGGAISATNGAQLNLGKNNNQCWNQSKCNIFENNSASKIGGRGGAIHLNDAIADLSHLAAYNNRADMATFIIGENSSEAKIRASMIYRNGNGGQDGWEDIYTFKTYDSILALVNITSANNASTGAVISQTNSGHILLNSIFYEPLQNLLADFVTTTSIKACLLMDDDNGMGTVQNSVIGNPGFIDAINDDYHLSSSSNAIDMCGYTPHALGVDMDGHIIGWDDPNMIDLYGKYDAGADESYAGDVIFKSDF